jgi:hypothetical protein
VVAVGSVKQAATRLTTFRFRAAHARHLFVLQEDMAPLLTLLVAVTGWNVETVKELPAEHKILDGRAVELQLVKRRRGAGRWNDTVTWEIGPPGRELHTPGGLYLLLHRLMARSRVFSGSVSLWSIWRHRLLPPFPAGAIGHADPFAVDLTGPGVKFDAWGARHDLTTDAAPDGSNPPRLPVHMGRLRTSIEVRRTRHLGGHLPSAARSNTIPVLFRNYLRGDPTTIGWAQDVIGSALLDAEQTALAAHRRSLDPVTSSPVVLPVTADAPRALGQETGWTTCTDPDEHPRTGQPCRSSFLDCFHCSNCLVTTDHLPRLLGLLATLRERRDRLGEQQWWQRYGPAWTAIRHDILVRFTPAQIRHAQRLAPTDAILDLVENPWERT